LSAGPGAPAPAGVSRRELSFDEGWRFHRGDLDGAEAPAFDDASWRELDIPHDWRIEDLPHAVSDDGGATADPAGFAYLKTPFPQGPPPSAIGPFDANADLAIDTEVTVPPLGHVVIPGGRGQAYTVGDVGWYRKRFPAPALPEGGGRVELRFDGVYQNADVWLNGVHLGFHPNGYTSFAFDLTGNLKTSGDNLLAVRVDNRGKTSRWYSGSGIYRHAWLTVTGAVRVPLWGVHVTTPMVGEERSTAAVSVEVANAGARTDARVRITVLDPSGRTVAVHEASAQMLEEGANVAFTLEAPIDHPALWSPEAPSLYQARAEVLVGERIVDTVTTPFGIRSLAFGGAGFRLNGKEIKIRGANVHHDHGPLGSAAIDRAEERKIEILKAAGFNAIRGAHNPRSPYLLDVCDRLGMLVYDEFSDMWDQPKMADDYHRHFPDWWERDLSTFVRRDRNHPSVIVWSIGNEIFEDPNDYGPRLAALVRSLDATRPVTQGGINVGPKGKDPWAYVDIGDFHGAPPAAVQAAHSDKAFLQSEDMAAQIFDDWALARDHPWYVGSWVWSGWDYIGESGSGVTVVAKSQGEAFQAAIDAVVGKTPYPWITNFQADIDLIGQRKPQSYWRAVVNGLSPLEMMVERPPPPDLQQFSALYCYYDELESWTWDVPPGQLMTVRVYTAGDAVTLLLNGKVLETRPVTEADKRAVAFHVPYAPGELTAVASRGGVQIARKSLATAGAPAALRLSSDVSTLTTRRGDLAHVLVEVVDEAGRLAPDAVLRVEFATLGAGELVGVANGNPHNADSFKRPRRWTWHGQALAILRPAKQPGTLALMATAAGLRPARLELPVYAPSPGARALTERA
jgi:beta-galactosidase